jgi:hypothetical protein
MQRQGGRARRREIESNQTSSIAAKMMLEIALARRLTFQHGSSGACLFVHGTKAVTSFLPTMTILSIARLTLQAASNAIPESQKHMHACRLHPK